MPKKPLLAIFPSMIHSAERDQNTAIATENAVLMLTVNGERMAVRSGFTLADFLRSRSLDPRLVVVEHNRVILRDREAYGVVALQADDTLEIVHFVGGG